MKKTLIVICFVMLSILLGGTTVADSTETSLVRDLRFCFRSDLGLGQIVDRPMLSLDLGIGIEYQKRLRVMGYRVFTGDLVELFDVSKYRYQGWEIQFGYVFRKGNIKLVPSIGYEFGRMTVGQGPLMEGWLGHYYESYKTEDVTFVPLSFGVSLRAIPILSLDCNLSVTPHPKYPMAEIMFGFTLEKWY